MQPVFKMVGDWNKTMKTTMAQALQASIHVYGRTAEQAVKHAVIRMAIAAKARTPKGKETRPVKNDAGGKYVERWEQGWSNPQKIYHRFFTRKDSNGRNIAGGIAGPQVDEWKWEQAKIIHNVGISKQSWMWGLGKWGAKGDQREVSGTSETFFVSKRYVVEAVKRNKFSSIDKIMPNGWQQEAEQAATNIIMKQAKMRMERDFAKAIARGGSAAQFNISQYFLPEAV